jgi:primosomal protein N' (replication factor Y)
MIAKGHDIPNVTLVGVISADIGTRHARLSRGRKDFQLLTQVAGRAGRGHIPGQVLVQTINPDHYAVHHAAAQDFEAFYNRNCTSESDALSAVLGARERSAANEKQETALRMSSEVAHLLTPPPENIKILGPAEAPVPKLKNEYRYQLLSKRRTAAR